MIRVPVVPFLALAGFLLLPAAGLCRAGEETDGGGAASDTKAEQKKKQESPGSAARQNKPGDAERAVKRPGAAEAPLRFDDDDLLKFRRGAARAEESGGTTGAPESVDAPDARDAEEGGTAEKKPADTAPPARKPTAKPQSAGDGPGAAMVAPPDPLKEFKDREEAGKFREERIKRSRDRIAQIQARLDYLRQKRAAILDPFRIMPKPETHEDQAGQAGLGAKELLAAVEQEIKSKEAELATAQQELVEVELRFAGPSE